MNERKHKKRNRQRTELKRQKEKFKETNERQSSQANIIFFFLVQSSSFDIPTAVNSDIVCSGDMHEAMMLMTMSTRWLWWWRM